MSHELHRKARPKSLDEVVGQPAAVNLLSSWMKKDKVPHTILFAGNSGCGKTTLARILAEFLNPGTKPKSINCADFKGIDTIRDIRKEIVYKASNGGNRVYIIDEAHQLTTAAQDSFLKNLEEPPDYVYFMLCTTDPSKLVEAVKTRCKRVEVKILSRTDMVKHLLDLSKKYKLEVSKKVIEKIAEVSNGSIRSGIIHLDACSKLKKESEQLDIVLSEGTETKVKDLFNSVLPWKGKAVWSQVAKVLETLDEPPETIRRILLTLAGNSMLKGERMPLMRLVLNALIDPVWDSKPLLIRAMDEIVNTKH